MSEPTTHEEHYERAAHLLERAREQTRNPQWALARAKQAEVHMRAAAYLLEVERRAPRAAEPMGARPEVVVRTERIYSTTLCRRIDEPLADQASRAAMMASLGELPVVFERAGVSILVWPGNRPQEVVDLFLKRSAVQSEPERGDDC